MKHPDVQALVYASFAQLRHCRYLLLRVRDAVAARAWLGQHAVLGLVKGGEDLGPNAATNETLTVAFSHAGLLAMGLVEDEHFPFPSAFREGMNQPDRARALADTGVETWRWGDLPGGARQDVHVLLAHFRRTAFESETGPLSVPTLENSGFAVVHVVNTCPSYIEEVEPGTTQQGTDDGEVSRRSAKKESRLFEPFGFRDGLSQPVLKSMADTSRLQRQRSALIGSDLADDSVVADGEFILGLPNEYGDPAYAPDDARWRASRPKGSPPQRFGTHGTYLAVRHIRQHVERFEAFAAAHPAPDAKTPSLVEKMVGRRIDGTPLVTCPVAPPDPDAFRYRVDDAEGFQCPLGAHIRRGNPRDTLGSDVASGVANAKLHRLIRRARIYAGDCQQAGKAGCGAPEGRRGCGQGLFFIALNADLDRQFEFVQQRWVGNPRFADLAGENDPIMGGPGANAFTVQGPAGGQRTVDIPAFTEMVGGGYFFMPGLAALRFLAHGGADASVA